MLPKKFCVFVFLVMGLAVDSNVVQAAFVHPGIFLSQSDLDRIKTNACKGVSLR